MDGSAARTSRYRDSSATIRECLNEVNKERLSDQGHFLSPRSKNGMREEKREEPVVEKLAPGEADYVAG